jgi:hypothetical protein
MDRDVKKMRLERPFSIKTGQGLETIVRFIETGKLGRAA